MRFLCVTGGDGGGEGDAFCEGGGDDDGGDVEGDPVCEGDVGVIAEEMMSSDTEEGAGEEEREEGGEEAGEERREEASEGELQLLVGEVCCCTFSSN